MFGRFGLLIICSLFSLSLWAQNAEVRGVVYNADNGQALAVATVNVLGEPFGDYSDANGLFAIAGLDTGKHILQVYSFGFDTVYIQVQLRAGQIKNETVYLSPASERLQGVEFSAAKQRKKLEVVISQNTIKPKQLSNFPTVGGEPDLVQYLQVLPGVVFSGDQGGQLYIRGGSPVMNRVLLDGMTIYNPFHSIGLFSVFDADILKTVDVYSAGFSSEYGGRISAIVDVETRDGNNKEHKAKFNASPFNAKVLLEGPIRRFERGRTNSSYILSYKNSYLDRSSKWIYPYINDGQLPYSFGDLYGKYSINASNGSYLKLFGFDYNDRVNFSGTTTYDWKAQGIGAKFLMVPGSSKTVIDGTINYSDYYIEQVEQDDRPRRSGINGYNALLNFTNFLTDGELKYGLEMNAYRTDFLIYNSLDRKISQFQNTNEISLFVNYRKIFRKKLIFEPGLRLQRYSSLGENRMEPRLRMKYNVTNSIRLKAAGGLYSQNLMSAVSDRDVVNLFYGFLSGPDNLPGEFKGEEVTSRLQKSQHAVAGVEYDVNSNLELNAEVYIKEFGQITNVNRNKIFDNNSENIDRPDYFKQDYVIERGRAYGYDVSLLYDKDRWYVWAVYSYNNVSREDERINYQPHFDRRHNINVVGSHDFGEQEAWNVNVRWNFGSGFPFTLTQGFYELLSFEDGADTDYTTANGDLGILYDQINRGRLPYYHRLDASIKRIIQIKTGKEGEYDQLGVTLSVTNIYNRNNIFYFDRVRYERVDQLPILPSVAVSYAF